jgi:aspartyl protease family protein
MPMSSNGRSLLTDLLGWAFASLMLVVAVVFHAELKSLGYWFAGVPQPTMMVAGANPRAEPVTAPQRSSSRFVELRAGYGGHFNTEAEVNGRRIDVMVDTGASIIALTYEDARRIGVAPSPGDYTQRVSTANGVARVAPVMLDRVQIGDILVRNVQAAVIEPGKLQVTLLGNSFLSRLGRYEMRAGRLYMEE